MLSGDCHEVVTEGMIEMLAAMGEMAAVMVVVAGAVIMMLILLAVHINKADHMLDVLIVM